MRALRTILMALLVLAPVLAAPPVTKQKWELTLFSWVKRIPAEPGAPPNGHPAEVEASTLMHALGSVRYNTGNGMEPLFGLNEAADLSGVLSSAFAAVGPGEDLELVSSSKREEGILASSLTITARLFVLEGQLHLLVHDTRLDFVSTYDLDYRIPKFTLGSRTTASPVTLQASKARALRPDWLALPLGPVPPPAPAAPVATAAPATVRTPPTAAPPAAAPVPPLTPSLSLEQRLLRLKQLRDQNLITEDEYTRRKQELLREI